MKGQDKSEDEMLPEYDFDYSKAKNNRFAESLNKHLIVIEPDLYEVFNSSEKVNNALRSIINAIPHKVS